MAIPVSSGPTAWAIKCPKHDRVYLTAYEYQKQLTDADARWLCPLCGSVSEFDDENYDAWENYEAL
jgi:hypothetical protein